MLFHICPWFPVLFEYFSMCLVLFNACRCFYCFGCLSLLFNVFQQFAMLSFFPLNTFPCVSMFFQYFSTLLSAFECFSILCYAFQYFSILFNASQCFSVLFNGFQCLSMFFFMVFHALPCFSMLLQKQGMPRILLSRSVGDLSFSADHICN